MTTPDNPTHDRLAAEVAALRAEVATLRPRDGQEARDEMNAALRILRGQNTAAPITFDPTN